MIIHHCAFRALAFSFLSALASTSNGADSTQPANTQFTLFNPTPRTSLRDWHTDHAGLSPYTTDAGHFEADLEAISYSTLERDFVTFGPFGPAQIKTSTESWLAGVVQLKAGLINSLDFELVTPGYRTITGKARSPDGSGGTATSQNTIDGFTDLSARLKLNLWGNDTGTTALALSGGVVFPTATHDFAHDNYSGGPGLEFAAKLPYEFEMRINCISGFYEANELEASVQNLISI